MKVYKVRELLNRCERSDERTQACPEEGRLEVLVEIRVGTAVVQLEISDITFRWPGGDTNKEPYLVFTTE